MTTNITANPLDPGNDELERYALEECLKRQRVDHRTSILIIPARRCDLAKRFARLEGSIVLANEPTCRQEIEGASSPPASANTRASRPAVSTT